MGNIIPTKKSVMSGIKDALKFGLLAGWSVAGGRAIGGGFGGALSAHLVAGAADKLKLLNDEEKRFIRRNAWMDWGSSFGL